MSLVHPTAVMEGDVCLEDNVSIGPFVTITGPVQIGRGTVIGTHTNIQGPVQIGNDNQIAPFCCIGGAPQDVKYKGEPTSLVIGDQNIIREFATFHRGSVGGGGITRIGSRGFFMAYCHIAHDCQVGDQVIFVNGTTLGGHVTVGDGAVVSAFTGVHQFCRIGPYAFIGGYSTISRDVLPFIKTVGLRSQAAIYGLNTIGLRRQGFTHERLAILEQAYKLLFRKYQNLKLGVEAVRAAMPVEGDVKVLVDFIESTKRGVIHWFGGLSRERLSRTTENSSADEGAR